jgi:hypothetical protein
MTASLIGLAFKPALGEGYAFLNDWTLKFAERLMEEGHGCLFGQTVAA